MYTEEELYQASKTYNRKEAITREGSSEFCEYDFQAGAKWATEQLTKPSLTIEDYLEMAHQRFESANYHSEFRMVEEAIRFMTDEQVIEYLKQVNTP